MGNAANAGNALEAVDPELALRWTTYDGIEIAPLYTAADAPEPEPAGLPGRPPFVRGAATGGGAWDVRTRHDGPEPAQVNAELLADLDRGATSLWLVLAADAVAPYDLPTVLAGVDLAVTPVVLDAGDRCLAAATQLWTLATGARADGAVHPLARGTNLGADPIGARARTGGPADLEVLRTLTEHSRGLGVGVGMDGVGIATVDATIYHDAGACDAHEIATATAVGVTYLRALTDAGLSVEDALAAVHFRFAVTDEQFGSIAKLRAARLVWDRVAVLCEAGTERSGQVQHAVTSTAMTTRRDPW